MMNLRVVELMIIFVILGFLALLIIGSVVAAVWVAARQAGKRPVTPPTQPAARDIQQTRSARGEMTRDEYLRMLDDLEGRKE
jgi:uncharacterized membrane protein